MKKIIFSIAIILITLFLTPYATAVLQNSLIGRWNLNEIEKDQIKDTSGYNLNGTTHGVNLVGGKFGNGLNFTTNTYVQIPNASQLEPANISVELWTKAMESPGQLNYLISKGAKDCFAPSYALYTGLSGGLFFVISDGNSFVTSEDAGKGIWDGKWHHVTGTFDGSFVRLFIDGRETGLPTPTSIKITYDLPDGNDMFLGRFNGSCIKNFNGQLDEVRIWNKALTSEEISQHAASNSSADPQDQE